MPYPLVVIIMSHKVSVGIEIEEISTRHACQAAKSAVEESFAHLIPENRRTSWTRSK